MCTIVYDTFIWGNIFWPLFWLFLGGVAGIAGMGIIQSFNAARKSVEPPLMDKWNQTEARAHRAIDKLEKVLEEQRNGNR